jgi:hypothetical protein
MRMFFFGFSGGSIGGIVWVACAYFLQVHLGIIAILVGVLTAGEWSASSPPEVVFAHPRDSGGSSTARPQPPDWLDFQPRQG